jgi:hypothetical protein
MNSTAFPGVAARSSIARLELVHVDSGAVVASRVRLDRLATPQHLAWLRGNSVPGDEAVLVVAPARWAHTFFAPAPTDVAFVDGDGRILEVRRGMKPWRVALAFKASGAIQGATGFIARTRTRVGDRLALREELAARPAHGAEAWQSDFSQLPDADRAEFQASVSAALQDEDSGADPWGVEPGDAHDQRPEAVRAEAPPQPAVPAPRPVEAGPARAEPGSLAPPKRAPSRAFLKGVDLATLTARQTPLAWFEAVAIVQELCAVLLVSRLGGQAADLELEDVAITSGGTVEVSGSASQGLPTVPQAGHILLALLGEAQTLPVQLRLLALQEVSPTPRCSTIREFSTQLAMFERPNRQTTIREVYQRFQALPAVPVEAPAAPAAKPARAARTRSARAPIWRNRRVQTGAALIAFVLVAGVAASWVWRADLPFLWGGANAGSPAASSGEGASLSAEAVERIREAAMRIWGAGARPSAPVAGKVPAAQPATLEMPAPVPSESFPSQAGPAPAVGGSAEPRPPAAESRVFTSRDPEVVPPVLERPHLPATPRPGVRVEDLPQVELVVSPTGDVESVKLVAPSAGVHSAMMLSAIKTWHFEPASKDGRPVRYRLTLRLTNQ